MSDTFHSEQHLDDNDQNLSGSENDIEETPSKKAKLDTEDVVQTAAGCDVRMNENIYERFTHFSHLEEDVPFNVGTFGIHSVKHVAYGQDAKWDKPYTDFVLIDGGKNSAWFRVYGDKAIECKDMKPQQVVHIEGFMWKKAYETATRAHGVSFECFGTLTDDSILEENTELSVLYAAEIEEETPHVYTLLELEKQYGMRVILMLDHKTPKTTGNKDGGKIDIRHVVFSTSDGVLVEITAFEEQIRKFDSLVDRKAYAITNLKVSRYYKYAKIVHRYTVTDQTTFTLSNVESVDIGSVKATLMDLVQQKDDDKNIIYESELFVRMQSAQVKNQSYYQTTGFEYDENSDVHMAAILHFHDSVVLHRGQKIRFKYHVKQSKYNKMELDIIPGSIEILPDDVSFPLEKIDTLVCKLI